MQTNRVLKIIGIIIAIIILFTIIYFIARYFMYGNLYISSNPDNATIYLNNVGQGLTPIQKNVKAGKYKLKITKENLPTVEKDIEIKAREKTELNFNLNDYNTGEKEGNNWQKSFQENPLLNSLPKITDHFKIDYTQTTSGDIEYNITLYAILNKPSQIESYGQELKQYKCEAIGWINSKKVDFQSLKIKWIPEESKNINVDINSCTYKEQKLNTKTQTFSPYYNPKDQD